MILVAPAVLGVPLRGGRRLIADPALPSYVTLSRTQTAMRATALGADDETWAEFAADAPRFHGSARRLLIEGQRSNRVRNPRAEGAVSGTPGTMPTYWGLSGLPSGIVATVLGGVTVSGVQCLRMRLNGTPAASQAARLDVEGLTAIAASNGQSWTSSVFLRLAAGSSANLQVNHRLLGRDGSGTGYNTISNPLSLGAALGRYGAVVTMSNAAITYVTTDLQLVFSAGQAMDATLDIGWPQLETGAMASSPMLPISGTPAVATRSADLVSATLTGLSIGANGACTVLVWAMLPQTASSGADQLLLSLDDGTGSNRFRLFNAAGGSALQLGRSLAGSHAAVTAGSIASGTVFKVGISIDGAGRAAASLNGAAVAAQTGGPVTDLTMLRIGNDAGNTAACFGHAAECRLLPYAVPDAALPDLVAALPG